MRFQFASLLLYNSPFNDAILEFNDGFLPVSRMILASHSEKFYLLFCENPKQAHFKDLNMKLKDFEVYYEYLHLDTHFKVDGDKMVSIMKVQAALQVYDLRLQIDNWLLSRQFASHLGSLFEKTKNKVLAKQHYLTRQIIGSNLKELCTVKAFGTFSRDNFLSFLNRDFIKTKDQGVLLEIIGQWVMYAFDTRKSDWLPLVKQLDFSNINFCILRFYLDENTQIFHIPELATYLFEKTRKTIRKEYPSIMPKYSKMMLFGGKAETDSIVEIDIQENSVKIIGQLSIGKVDHCAEQIGDYVFVLGDAENEQVEKFAIQFRCLNNILF
uniref:BTB domain-containing protein n=1 Tax=Rhabditophanes sp. KR3021 TaxID=114890 RepID=A0AC35TSZ1_9BILA